MHQRQRGFYHKEKLWQTAFGIRKKIQNSVISTHSFIKKNLVFDEIKIHVYLTGDF